MKSYPLGASRVERRMFKARVDSLAGLAMPDDLKPDDVRLEIRLVNLPVPRSEVLDLSDCGAWCITDRRVIINPISDIDTKHGWVDASEYL